MNSNCNIPSVKVVKFGGSSLADAKQFLKVKSIIESDPSRVYVIPSAPGKRFDGDTKVTDMLLSCHALFGTEGFDQLFTAICERYNGIISDLGLDISLEDDYKKVREALAAGCAKDYVASRGEYLNGKILAKLLGFNFVDAADIILFDEEGNFNATATDKCAGSKLKSLSNAVIPGFYGAKPDGTVKTFSRGGSDITGAIVARSVMADIYENWTDVSGFLMCDPRIVKNPKQIGVITYRELRELSYMGATVLHEDSIFPVKLAGIPINIRNTNNPSDEGTMIVASSRCKAMANDDVITGIAGKKGFSVINIEKDMMNQELGVGYRVLQVLTDMKISFEHLPSGIDTMSVVVFKDSIKGREREILDRITAAVNPDNIDIESNLALIAVVGRGMIRAAGTASRVFTAVAREGINIRMIDQGSSELNIIIGVDESDFENTVKTIYNEFVK
ncbi:MAG: aspartate kinase [Eubacteriales bacterium]|nr:aspartate kinase [Eubacteriales bacterium]